MVPANKIISWLDSIDVKEI